LLADARSIQAAVLAVCGVVDGMGEDRVDDPT
jgi:hypothetical protein